MARPESARSGKQDSVHPFFLAVCILALAIAFFYFLPKNPAPADLSREWRPGAPSVTDFWQKNVPVTPTETEMLQTITGTIRELSVDSIIIRTEWPTASGLRIIDRVLMLSPVTIVKIHGAAKDPEAFKTELAEYEENAKTGAVNLEPPFPNEIRVGSTRDLQVGMHVTVRPREPGAKPLVIEEIVVPMPPLPVVPVPTP